MNNVSNKYKQIFEELDIIPRRSDIPNILVFNSSYNSYGALCWYDWESQDRFRVATVIYPDFSYNPPRVVYGGIESCNTIDQIKYKLSELKKQYKNCLIKIKKQKIEYKLDKLNEDFD